MVTRSGEAGHGRGEVVVYETPDGSVRVEVRLERESLWLSLKQMAELLGTSVDNVGLHLKNIYLEGELDEVATTEESSVVRTEGIADNPMVALALLIAESEPAQKELMIRLVLNLLEDAG